MSIVQEVIPFVIPQEFGKQVATGTVRRFGTLLIEKNRIVGHVQEAAPLRRLIWSANPGSMFLGSGTLASSVTANIQLEQVKNMLSGLQLLTGAALAASIVGIGVSIAGFAMVNNKLNGINDRLNALSEKLTGLETALRQITDHHRIEKFARLTSLLALGEEAWNKDNKFATWGKISDQLLEEDHYYRHLFSGTTTTSSIFLDEAYPLEFCVFILENLVTVNATRFQSLLLCRELEVAKQYSVELSAVMG